MSFWILEEEYLPYTSASVGWILLGEKAIEKDSTAHFAFAVFFFVQDKKQEALTHVEKALENGYRDIVWIKLIPDLDQTRSEPRFQKLMELYFG